MSDSFENILDDSRCTSCVYAHRRGKGPVNNTTCRGCMFGDPVTCHEEMQHDLVRRCNRVAAGSVNIGEVAAFPNVLPGKEQALKVLEEAAEVFGAWQAFNADQDGNTSAIFLLLDECADVIQAVSNLIAALNVVDFAPYMEDCRERNEKRGRVYESAVALNAAAVKLPVDSEGKPVKPGDFVESLNTHEKSKVKEMSLTQDLRWRVITERWTFYADTTEFRRVEPERTWDDLESELAKAILDDGEARYFVARAKEIAGVSDEQ